MKKYCCCFVLTLALLLSTSSYLSAQSNEMSRPSPFKQLVPQNSLDTFNLRLQQINRRGMYALTGWSAANLIYGAIAAPLTTNNGELQAFHTTNALWGGINLLISVPGVLASSKRANALNLGYGKTIKVQHSTEKLFLINAGLDLGYIGGGAAMWGFSNRFNNPKTRNSLAGVGESFILQGGFLLVFDWTMYIVQAHHGSKGLNKYIAGLAYTGTGISYKLQF